MKIILIFIFISFSANALTVRERLDVIGIRLKDVAIKANLDRDNINMLAYEIVKNNDLVKLNLLESKLQEVIDEENSRAIKEQQLDLLKAKLSQYNCSAMNDGFIKDLCFYMKR